MSAKKYCKTLSYQVFDDITYSDMSESTVTDTSSYTGPIFHHHTAMTGGDEMSDEELNAKRDQFLLHSPGRRKAYRVRRRSSKRLSRRSYVISHITVRVQ